MFPSKYDLHLILREHLIDTFGVTAAGLGLETQGTSSGSAVHMLLFFVVETDR
jgi:hypothetical protein